MRHIWEWASRIYFLILASSIVLAEDDLEFNPSSNFRPDNVTGLNQIYDWVGSYYNATTEIELTPTIGNTSDSTVCPNLRNHTTILKWTSILAITQSGTYNSGTNPVNLWLMMFPPNYNMSAMPWKKELLMDDTPIMLALLSSQPTWKMQENDTVVPDLFNMTATKNPNSSFTLSGEIHHQNRHPDDDSASRLFTIDMPACNASREYGNWSMAVHESKSYIPLNWNEFTLPNVTVDFDAHTANLTLDGTFLAYPFLRSGKPGMLYSEDAHHGRIQIRFRGVLDAYNSDILDVNSTSPTWLRTVGFGNNTLNIENSSDGGSPLRSALWSALYIPFLVTIIICT